jgi:thymidine kinase
MQSHLSILEETAPLIEKCQTEGSFDGRIEMICGPMFSGKTSELARQVRRHVIAARKCIVIRYAEDIRYSSDSISTHDKVTYPAISATVLGDVKKDVLGCDVIGIDEGQFFPDIWEFCTSMRNLGKIVIVSALDMNWLREDFPAISKLLGQCELSMKCKAVCVVCKQDATYSKRLTSETTLKVIGGSDKYAAVCLRCHEFGFGNFSLD